MRLKYLIRFLYKIVFYNYKNKFFLFKSLFVSYYFISCIIQNNLYCLNNFLFLNSFKQKLIFIILKKSFRHRYLWFFKKKSLFKIKFKFFKKKKFLIFKKKKSLNKLIKLKRFSGLFKRRVNMRTTVLSKRGNLFRFFSKNLFKKKFKKFKKRKFSNYRVSNIDLSKKKKMIIFENRRIIRIFLKNKSLKKQNKLNSFLISILSKNSKQLLSLFEFGLNIILIRSHIFNNLKDSDFFIKKGYIFVNGSAVYNTNLKVKNNDLIKLINKKYYYSFYRDNLNDSIYSLKKLNWAFYKFKKKRRKKKIFPKVYHWIYNWNHFGFDIPYFIEVDYVNLTVFILEKPYSLFLYNHTSLKYLNFYLTRLYNWSYIT